LGRVKALRKPPACAVRLASLSTPDARQVLFERGTRLAE
jgi:hypothetical protein